MKFYLYNNKNEMVMKNEKGETLRSVMHFGAFEEKRDELFRGRKSMSIREEDFDFLAKNYCSQYDFRVEGNATSEELSKLEQFQVENEADDEGDEAPSILIEKVEKVKTLKELKKQYDNNLEDIRDFEDLKALACNFIRMVTWKKVKDLDYISKAYYHVHGKIIHDILKNGYDEALKTIKLDNLHKAYNINYLYEYYGLDYSSCKEEIKNIRLNIIG